MLRLRAGLLAFANPRPKGTIREGDDGASGLEGPSDGVERRLRNDSPEGTGWDWGR